jgi:hypothetical protein
MSATLRDLFGPLTGDWTGVNLFRLMPEDEYASSDSTARVELAAGGNAVTIRYTWSNDDGGHDGLLVLTAGEEEGSARSIILDSFHSSPQWLELAGRIGDDGTVTTETEYGPAEMPGRWRIHVDTADTARLRIRMDNVYGDADYQAVEGTYHRT